MVPCIHILTTFGVVAFRKALRCMPVHVQNFTLIPPWVIISQTTEPHFWLYAHSETSDAYTSLHGHVT